MTTTPPVVEQEAREFLACGRIAVVGASADDRQFGNVVYRALRDQGIDAVPVHPGAAPIAGAACAPDLASVPGRVDGVVVMVPAARAADVVRQCADAGIGRVWLFKGLGGPGAVSDDVLALCRHYGLDTVAGACPLMFLAPVGGPHRVHRFARRVTHSLVGPPS